MSRPRLTFEEWKRRLRQCAWMMRQGEKIRDMHKVADGIMRHCYALVCHLAHHPATRILYEDYEQYYLRQNRRAAKYLLGPIKRLDAWTHKRLLRHKTKPATCSAAFWRIHLDWRKRHKHYATIPENPVSPAKGEP